jgi:Rrf2 family transcriptional regulator, nitric oxide-sensitive transcriptional repressor
VHGFHGLDMRLTRHTDLALRVLLYATAHRDRRVTIDETVAALGGLSRGHVMKVIATLGRAGFIVGQRGRAGGFRLARDPRAIRLGSVLRATEPDFAIFECLGSGTDCVIPPACRLPRVAQRARAAFMAEFDRYTLAEVAVSPRAFTPAGTGGAPHAAE